MSTRRSGRKSITRRSSGRLRYSRLINASGFLDNDSNVIEDEEQPGWWKNLENNSMATNPSIRFSVARESGTILDPDSNINLLHTPDKWWDHLDTSASPRVLRSQIESRTTPQKQVPEETDKDLSQTSSEEKSIRKKRPQLLKKTRQSLGGKAFAEVLDTSDEPSKIESLHGNQKHAQDSSVDSLSSVHRNSIKKTRPLIKSQRKLTKRKSSSFTYPSTDGESSKLRSMDSEAVHSSQQNQSQQDESNVMESEHEISVRKHRVLPLRKSPRSKTDKNFEAALASDEESVSSSVEIASNANAYKLQSVGYPTQQNEHPKEDSSLTKNMKKLNKTNNMGEDEVHGVEKRTRSSYRITSGNSSEVEIASDEESVASVHLHVASDQDAGKSQSIVHPTQPNEYPNKHSGYTKDTEKSNQPSSRSEDQLHVNEKSLSKQHISRHQNVTNSSPNTGKEDRELSRTSTKEDNIRKKRMLLTNKRKSLGGNAFAQVLESSSDATEPEPDYEINRNQARNTSARTSLSEHENSTHKMNSSTKSQHKITDALDDENDIDAEGIRTESTHISEKKKDKRNISDETLQVDPQSAINKGRQLLVRIEPIVKRNLFPEGVSGSTTENTSRVTKNHSFESVHRSSDENASKNLHVTSDMDAAKLQSVINISERSENTNKSVGRTKNNNISNTSGMKDNHSQAHGEEESIRRSSRNKNEVQISTLSVIEKEDRELSRTSTKEDNIRKKRMLLTNKRKSLGGNAFAQVLESSSDATEAEPDYEINRNQARNTSVRTSLSEHENSIHKMNSLTKSQLKITDALDDENDFDAEGIRTESTHISEEKRNKRNMSDETLQVDPQSTIKKGRQLLVRIEPIVKRNLFPGGVSGSTTENTSRVTKDHSFESVHRSSDENASKNLHVTSDMDAAKLQSVTNTSQRSGNTNKSVGHTKNRNISNTSGMKDNHSQAHGENESIQMSFRNKNEVQISTLSVIEKEDRELSATTIKEDSIRKKKTSFKNKRKSLGGKAFAQVLESSSDTSEPEPDYEIKRKRARNTSARTSLSEHENSINKVNSFSKSQHNVTDALDAENDFDAEGIQAESTHVSDKKRDKRNISDEILQVDPQSPVKKGRQSLVRIAPIVERELLSEGVSGSTIENTSGVTKNLSFKKIHRLSDKNASRNLQVTSHMAAEQSINNVSQHNENTNKHNSQSNISGNMKDNQSQMHEESDLTQKDFRNGNELQNSSLSGKKAVPILHTSSDESESQLNVIEYDSAHVVKRKLNMSTQDAQSDLRNSVKQSVLLSLDNVCSFTDDKTLGADHTLRRSSPKKYLSKDNIKSKSSGETGKGKRISESSQGFSDDEDQPIKSKSIFDQEKMKEVKKILEEVTKKELASMKNTRIDTYFKPVATSSRTITTTNRKVVQSNPNKKPSQKPLAPVDKAYIVNGQVYKRPRLPRPKTWVTDRLYHHLWKCLEPRYKLRTRIRSEQFVLELTKTVVRISKRKKYNDYKNDLEALIKDMAELEIIKTRNDFYHFCQDFLPYDFRRKAVPMLLPGNVRNIPYDPESLNVPILEIQ